MKFTDLFIRRPVLASVIGLLILVLGMRAYYALPVLQIPRTENAVVTVTTTYYGADPDMVAGFITTPLRNRDRPSVRYRLYDVEQPNSDFDDHDLSAAQLRCRQGAHQINTKISSVLTSCRAGTQQPVLTVQDWPDHRRDQSRLQQRHVGANQITDSLTRVVQPKLQTVPGVQTAELLGQKVFALRAWLDPQKLAAFGLTAADVSVALAANDFISGIGTTKGQMVR